MKTVATWMLLSMAVTANALDVEGFEAVSKKANGAASVEAMMAKSSLLFYFAGISDVLNGARDQTTGEIYYAGPKKVCLPAGATLNADTLHAMTATEVRKASQSGAFKEGWKRTNLNLFVFLALTTNYPCS